MIGVVLLGVLFDRPNRRRQAPVLSQTLKARSVSKKSSRLTAGAFGLRARTRRSSHVHVTRYFLPTTPCYRRIWLMGLKLMSAAAIFLSLACVGNANTEGGCGPGFH